MTRTLTIVGLGGSLARTSRSRAALQVALEGAATAGAETTLLDLRELALPMYNPDAEDEPPESAQVLIESCYQADGMLWSSPMYQGTISGAFKNALDWLHALGSREPPFLHDEVIGMISAAGGTQGLQAINTMEFAVRALRGWAVPYVIPVASAFRVFDSDGRVTDEGIELQLRTLRRGRACRHSLCRPRDTPAREGMRRVGRARRCCHRLDRGTPASVLSQPAIGRSLDGTPPAVRLAGVVKRFGSTTALAGVDLATLLRPDAGQAELLGLDVVADPAKVREQLALTGRFAAVDDLLTGRQNLEMFGRLFRLSRTDARRRASELLQRFELIDAADRTAKTYSGGPRAPRRRTTA